MWCGWVLADDVNRFQNLKVLERKRAGEGQDISGLRVQVNRKKVINRGGPRAGYVVECWVGDDVVVVNFGWF